MSNWQRVAVCEPCETCFPDEEAAKAQLPDLVVSQGNFSPTAPFQAPPGTPLNCSLRLENRSAYPSGGFWLEFWGSRNGGLTLDEFVADSQWVPSMAPWQVSDLNFSLALYSIPDGPYTIVFVADRPQNVGELNEGNNRFAVPGKRLLTIRPQSQANLVVEGFSVTGIPNPGGTVQFGGRVRNAGTQASGPFWIEFIGTRTPENPQFDMFLCDSIRVQSLGPGEWVNLSSRTLYPWLPSGPIAIVGFADRTDLVYETAEQDNYVILPGFTIP